MNLNEASAEDLERVAQIDGARCRYLIDYRNKVGGFRSWEDVKQVPSFEEGMVENLRSAGLSIGPSRGDSEARSTTGESSGTHSSGKGRRRTLNVNKASAEELESVFQMDGQRASYLIDARNRLGGFKSWEEVKREVPSFEDGMIENLKQAGATLER